MQAALAMHAAQVKRGKRERQSEVDEGTCERAGVEAQAVADAEVHRLVVEQDRARKVAHAKDVKAQIEARARMKAGSRLNCRDELVQWQKDDTSQRPASAR